MNNIIFFGGKGGVGKTSCSSAFAISKTKQNLKVLLVSTDPAHSISDLFNVTIGDQIVKLADNLFGYEIDAQNESEKYISSIRKNLKRILSPIIIEELNKQLDAASVSPGSHESALFDKMIQIIIDESENFDLIIFDTAPTGHTVRLLSLPEILGAWIDSLMRKRRKTLKLKTMVSNVNQVEKENDPILKILQKRKDIMEKARKIMVDDKKLAFMFVLNAEKLPIEETKKAIKILTKYNIPVNNLVVNKILPDNPTNEFWITKKKQEKKYLNKIYTMNINKVYEIPMFKFDMDENTIYEMAKYF
ncbi:MAG: TRC40/GET3/ArsA family transport-energizing ATPase [Bacillota bacterium]|nr:TRC40/GET3/ArsA family transport-energizing ATPase [Bacillota bacterium]